MNQATTLSFCKNFASRASLLVATFCLLLVSSAIAFAQASTAPLQGTVADPKGAFIPKAAVIITNEANGKIATATTDSQGRFSVSNLATGSYTIEATAPGFATSTRKGVKVAADHADTISLSLPIGETSQDITVEATEVNSVAAALAPMDALLSETSARTEITPAMIQNFMSPVADYGEAVQMAPSTFTLSSDGIGLGQSKTYFRGFPDGDYDIDFDGIPFYDTNSPTHHSWAFFPTQWLGGIDFDRSPGTASTIGPTPFGGSIHLLSKTFDPVSNIRGTFSYGSYNTYLYDGQYDSGSFGPGHKLNVMIDVHHLGSDGYQTFNYQTYNAGDLQVQYKLSEKTTITGFSGVIWVDANTPNLSATRCQMYGAPADGSYTCTGANAPYTGAGINFLLVNNSDPTNYFDYQYNYYHVPTDFEYVGVHSEFARGWTFDIKPYTYNYDNSEKYSNAVGITDNPLLVGTTTSLGLTVAATCSTIVSKASKTTGITTSAEPCGVDKYNSYRKYGETSEITQASKLGIFRAGLWYEWANTNRHQYPSDPLTNWTDQPLPNFAEKFVTNSYQPFAEYQFNVLPKLQITPGVKLAYYTISTQQFADDGKTIGNLGTGPANNSSGNPNAFITNAGSYYATLPSLSANYRIKNNWSVYAQAAQGSIVPPSSVFDFNQSTSGAIAPQVQLPKQQKNTTYQAGTVLKLKQVTFDADYYHIHFDNSYACTSTSSAGDDNSCSVQPSSITQGIEGESNIYLSHGLSIYLNASYDQAVYEGTLAGLCTGTAAVCAAAGPAPIFTAPSGLNVAQTPSDVETEGVTYQHKALDLGFFNKRIGTQWVDNPNVTGLTFHNQQAIAPFDFANLFFNYTLRTGGRFDNTKLRLSFNNLFNSHAITGDTFASSNNPLIISVPANGTTYTNPFTTTGPTLPNGGDNLTVIAARSISLTVTFGFSPKGR